MKISNLSNVRLSIVHLCFISGVFRYVCCFSQFSYDTRHQQGLSMQDHVRVRFWLEANLEFDPVHGFCVRVVSLLFTSSKDVKGF